MTYAYDDTFGTVVDPSTWEPVQDTRVTYDDTFGTVVDPSSWQPVETSASDDLDWGRQ